MTSKAEVFSQQEYCDEKKRFLAAFTTAARELIEVQEQQLRAVLEGDPDFARFDLLIHMAAEKKQQAKYAYISHVDAHRC